jgi:hypothetical protein
MRIFSLVLGVSIALSGIGTATAAPAALIPPVDATVITPFRAPGQPYGAGHRGVDFAVPEGTSVRAAAAGTVKFAGEVAGRKAVSIDHGDGLETTYSWLSEVLVEAGQAVGAGMWIGRAAEAHPGARLGLHFGVKIEGEYVDPRAYLGALDAARAVRLAPWQADDSEVSGCRDATFVPDGAPNDNVAVAVAGIGSRTKGELAAAMYEHGPELLGYPGRRIYRFSYAGASGPALHVPYARSQTYRDLRDAAGELAELLRRVAERHPNREIDLIAHSQGGVVARIFLEAAAESWDPELPRVEHLVTFATPHLGAPLAELPEKLRETTLTGGLLLDAVSAWADDGGPVPDPRSPAVAQLAPDSHLMKSLAAEDIVYGTRALSLAMPHDVVVPADRTHLEGEQNRILGPQGLNAHEALLSSDAARGVAHAFLRDAVLPCPTGWDRWGPVVGKVVGFAENRLAGLYGRLEDAALRGAGRLVTAARRVGRLIRPGVAAAWP